MDQMLGGIKKAVNKYFPDTKIVSIKDRGVWLKHNFEVILENDDVIFFKIQIHPEWGNVKHEANVINFFEQHDISVPQLIILDTSCTIIPYPYIIQEKVGGTRLGNLIEQVNKEEQIEIYKVIGRLYRKMHNIKNDKSGLWNDEPRKILYSISPNDYMFNQEIVNGSGKLALEKEVISKKNYDRIVSIWKVNIDYLKKHEPSLVHVSPFLWNIYLEKKDKKWMITKLMSLGDVMWWDSAYDIATIQYPPFGNYNNDRWIAFLDGYGIAPDRKRILLYAIMHRLCASMGTYMEPKTEENRIWKENCLKDIDLIIDEIESSNL